MLFHNEKYISGYLDGQLTEKQKVLVEKHLKKCKICSSKLKSFQKLKSDMCHLSKTSKPQKDFIPLIFPYKKIVYPRMPVYDTITYKLGLAFFMNGFLLKFESFSTAWISILGFYALLHLFLYIKDFFTVKYIL